MKLMTEATIPDYPFRLDHQSNILMMGSCFTDNIGRLLEKYLFQVCVNPFGVTYNPLSVKKGLEALIQRKAYTINDLDHYNNLWFSFDHYTGFSSPDRDDTLKKINLSFDRAKEMLLKANFLVITWGTAWVYTYKATGEVVCNCHKIPANQFTRSRLSTKEIIGAYESFLSSLFELNPNIKVMLTVSPVRHLKEGAHGNQLSKATLLLAGETLKKLYPDQLFYFPSYEIVMDELRDYRFYSPDMVHISDQATQYIWKKFDQALLSNDARNVIKELEPLLKMMGHRPQMQHGEASRKLIKQRDEKLRLLKNKYPSLAWENMLNSLQ
ncbi:MAG: GSCFA domain-containing protein [Bacteroidota bacterium]